MRALSPALVLAAVVVGCGFPSLDYEANDGGNSKDAADEADGASSSSSGADAAQDSPVDVPTSDAATDGEAGDPCDQDGDGYKNMMCGGNDCCDTDGKAHPGQTAWFTAQDHCSSFDYDCDGKDQHEYPASLTCGYVWSLGCIPSCSGTSCVCGGTACSTGYVGPDPGCGVGAEYDQCQPANAFSCTPKSIAASQVQACH